MATYEYECNNPNCQLVFEKTGKKMEDAKKDEECPKCFTRAKRVFSLPAAIII